MIRFENVSFSYPNKQILSQINFSVPRGKTYGLVGESGSGKTTTLRLTNGLLKPSSGKVFLNNEKFDFSQGELWRRKMGYSIQGSGLFPHMSIADNMSLIARKEGWNKDQISERLQQVCELVNLPFDAVFLQKLPRQISGGQQQRVGIARALFMEPQIMLMDEPFGALDPITREEIQNEFIDLQEKLRLTIMLVTHDLGEAFRMCDKIVLLNNGRVAQVAKPADFLLRPANDYVKKFMETHSPGHVLKSVKLYSVISDQILVTEKTPDGYKVIDLDSQETREYANEQNFIENHRQRHQEFVYWVNNRGHFLGFQNLQMGRLGEKHQHSLRSRDDIVTGMKYVMSTDLPLIPVVASDGVLQGVFSKGALDAL
jgi:osmoprotectant transport system ATP-binding protein